MQQSTNNIPPFDERGNLPTGVHKATIKDVISFFGGKESLKRHSLGKVLQDFYKFVQPYAKAIYVDGSFVTIKLSPNDVDIFMIVSTKTRNDRTMYQSFVRFIGRQGPQGLHIKVCFENDLDQEAYWLNWFTMTRKDEMGNQFPKGIISLELNND